MRRVFLPPRLERRDCHVTPLRFVPRSDKKGSHCALHSFFGSLRGGTLFADEAISPTSSLRAKRSNLSFKVFCVDFRGVFFPLLDWKGETATSLHFVLIEGVNRPPSNFPQKQKRKAKGETATSLHFVPFLAVTEGVSLRNPFLFRVIASEAKQSLL